MVDEVVVVSGTVVVVSGTVVSSTSVSEFINTTNPEPITNDITKIKYICYSFLPLTLIKKPIIKIESIYPTSIRPKVNENEPILNKSC